MSTSDPKITAQKLADNLAAFYQKYEAASLKLEMEESNPSKISGWFLGNRAVANNKIHQQFYDSVQKRCGLLCDSLTAVAPADPEFARQIAAQAVAVILNPIPDELRDVGGWMRFAAEPLSAPLFKWLSREDLAAIREKYLDIYPKRKMFKTQKALLKEIDAQLKAKS